jgi:hypothetical protein
MEKSNETVALTDKENIQYLEHRIKFYRICFILSMAAIALLFILYLLLASAPSINVVHLF